MELLAFALVLWLIFRPRKKKKKRSPKIRSKEQFYVLPSCTLDKHTCPICAKHDGAFVPVNKARIGVNVPPFHDGCRCTTVTESTKFPSRDHKRYARNPLTGEGYHVVAETYQDWIKTLSHKERNALIEYRRQNRR